MSLIMLTLIISETYHMNTEAEVQRVIVLITKLTRHEAVLTGLNFEEPGHSGQNPVE